MRRPRPLVPGDRVRVIAPSSPFVVDRLPAGVQLLRDLGLEVACPEGLFASDRYLAGGDDHRAGELLAAFGDTSAAAVIPARGGYGAMRILGRLDGRRDLLPPKLLMGFSDITALHLFFWGDLATFHGPNVISAASADDETRDRHRRALMGEDPEGTFRFDGLRPLAGGVARGRIVAGNLALVAALAGTPWAARLDGAILVLEDVGEPAYRIDRMLTSLAMQPGAPGIAGFAFGDLGVPEAEREALAEALRGFAHAWGKPVVTGFPAGHGARNFPVPEGVLATLDADRGALWIEESPYGF